MKYVLFTAGFVLMCIGSDPIFAAGLVFVILGTR